MSMRQTRGLKNTLPKQKTTSLESDPSVVYAASLAATAARRQVKLSVGGQSIDLRLYPSWPQRRMTSAGFLC
jgi:hypothetical protein